MTTLKMLKEVEVVNFTDRRGTLNVAEFHSIGIFETKRVYYISNVPESDTRGSHAHKTLNQVFFAVSGKFTLTVTDGVDVESVELRPYDKGYFLPCGYWRNLENFTSDAVCLVLASEHYDESDYIRSFDEYLEWAKNE
jgi:mannose-6-phosphate isomerase-like protein (cupin superfamily)